MIDKRLEEPPRWLWLWGPLLSLALERAAFIRDYTWFDTVYTEAGAVEYLTAVALVAGVVAGIAILRHRERLPTKWLRVWVTLVTLACFYAVGEDLNWGQEIFHWKTPAAWAAINEYNETDFSGLLVPWAKEIPRQGLWGFILVGMVHMLLQRGVKKGDWRALFWPTSICLPIVLLAMLIRSPLTLELDTPDLHRGDWEELEELYLAWFLFLYLLSIWYRLGMEGGHLRTHDGRINGHSTAI